MVEGNQSGEAQVEGSQPRVKGSRFVPHTQRIGTEKTAQAQMPIGASAETNASVEWVQTVGDGRDWQVSNPARIQAQSQYINHVFIKPEICMLPTNLKIT